VNTNVLEIERHTFGNVWLTLLDHLVERGAIVSPRGKPIREFLNVTLHVSQGLNNVLVCPTRKPSYRFMVAEWLWMWFGHDDVKTIAQYNSHIAQFSDNGTTFAGAYGPQIKKQWLRTQNLLDVDPDTRQAVIEIYQTPASMTTKDVPCTLSVQFFIRRKELHTVVNMRSSDIWLGLPYDFFNFSMLGNVMAAIRGVEVGSVTYHIGSSHIYETNLEKAHEILLREDATTMMSPKLKNAPPLWLDDVLAQAAHATNGQAIVAQAPWLQYANVLLAPDNSQAKQFMEGAYVAGSAL
jgi:thymidylate synthase